MAPKRRKSPTQKAPQTVEQAALLLGEYIATAGKIEKQKADADASIASIEAVRDAFVAPLETELKDLFKQLRVWWAASKDEMTDGKRRSIELAGAKIGERTTTPSLKLPTGVGAEAFIEWLIEQDLNHLVRIKKSVDRQAAIKDLRAGGSFGKRLSAKGAKVSQKEEFFIDRAGVVEPDPEIIDTELEGETA